jgi:YD repeat-containing protein
MIRARAPLAAAGRLTTTSFWRLARFTDAKGSTFHYTYDGIDRLTEMVQPDTSATRYTYGCCSLQSISDASGTLRFEYDPANRLTRFINAKNQRIHYGYDANGNLTTLTYPDGKVARYTYDTANRLQTVTDWLGNSTVHNYDAAGNLFSSQNANGTLTGYQYDAGNLLMALINASATGKIIASYRSAFDRHGNRTHMMTFAPPGVTLAPQRVTHTYAADNRLQTANETTFTHDANGNLTVTAGTHPKTYTYDALDRLTQVTFPGYQAQYHYDGLGHRIARTVDGETTQYIVNPNGVGSQVLAETDGQELQFKSMSGQRPLPKAGTYTVFVRSDGAKQTGSYEFTVQRTKNACQAMALPCGTSQMGTLTGVTHLHAYTFPVTAGDSVPFRYHAGRWREDGAGCVGGASLVTSSR